MAEDNYNADDSVDDDNKQLRDEGYFFFSSSKEDCNKQDALECQALTLEPKSGFYEDPIVVCDFTALYPSLIIAYNLCYSTIAGKLDYHSTRREMMTAGKTTGRVGPFRYDEFRTATVLKHHMKSLVTGRDADPDRPGSPSSPLDCYRKDRSYVLPTGAIFVSETVLKGVLPQVLDEMLSTRAMLKRAAKEYRQNIKDLPQAVLRQLEARQLALKYVANVIYGYTSATFSGRSACPTLADAVVECGRRTLKNAIDMANEWGKDSSGKWTGAQVVYGDTDSLFIKLPGRSIKDAFAFGKELCKAVTAANPPPVQLKLEKVYASSMMQTKKKYCGMMYESPDQVRPTFDAKGIETVRKDQCRLTQRILKEALVTLFEHGLPATRRYLCDTWQRVHADQFPISDFILTGRVRDQYRGGRMGPVQAVLARRLREADPGHKIRHKERLPYVIVAAPGINFKLKDCVFTPLELLEQWDAYSIHNSYYVTRHLNAALKRCLGLSPFKVDVDAWYRSCPKPKRRIHHWPVSKRGGSIMISSYFGSDICAFCSKKCMSQGSSKTAICNSCFANRSASSITALEKLKHAQRDAARLSEICTSCNGCHEDAGTFAVERVMARRTACTRTAAQEVLFMHGGGIAGGSLRRPLARCLCVDCPVTFARHRAKETEMFAQNLCSNLELF